LIGFADGRREIDGIWDAEGLKEIDGIWEGLKEIDGARLSHERSPVLSASHS